MVLPLFRGQASDRGACAVLGFVDNSKGNKLKLANSGCDQAMKKDSTRPLNSSSTLSATDHAVLNAFRRYLMAPGKMLCFTAPEVVTLGDSLALLTHKGLLVAERFPGSYSLTKAGFKAMQDAESSR